MSAYNGRRGPNVSQYLRELNAIPTQDSPLPEESFNMDDDLAMFTNTQFYDYDSGQNTDYNAPPVKPDTAEATQPLTENASVITDFAGGYDFIADFNLADFGSAYTSPTIPTFPDTLANLQHLQPPPPGALYTAPLPQQSAGFSANAVRGGEKRKAESPLPPVSTPTGPLSLEDQSRLAAEEDKRRRNTAASARFRKKKKQREQALEKSSKEMSDKVTMLEGRIQQLETENKWLKNLIVEKNDKSASGDDMVKLWKDFGAKQDLEKKMAEAKALKEKAAESVVTVASSVMSSVASSVASSDAGTSKDD